MKARIVKCETKTKTWFEIQVLFLGIIWIDADLYRGGFPSVFLSESDAVWSISKLIKTKTKKTVVNTLNF